MSIDTEVHGDATAVTAVGTMLQDMAQALADAAVDLTGLRGDTDAAWDGFASGQVLATFDRTQGEVEQFSGQVETLATAVTALGTALDGVTSDMAALRAEAIGEGLPNAAIARRLHLGVPTVKTHVTAIFGKLEVTNRVQVALVVHDADGCTRRSQATTSAWGASSTMLSRCSCASSWSSRRPSGLWRTVIPGQP